MDKVLHCECGFEARAAHEDGLVAEVQRHAWEAHGMPLSRNEALLLAFHAELDREALPRGLPRHERAHREKGAE